MSIQARQELLRRADDLRAKQDARLDRVYRRSTIISGATVTVAGLASAVAVAPAAGATQSQTVALIAFSLLMILANGAIWFLVNSAPFEWQEGPDIRRLKPILNHDSAHQELLEQFIDIQMEHHSVNETTINRLKAWVGIQAATTVVCIAALMVAALTLG